MDRYVSWLKDTKQTLFETAGTYWRLYQNALVPASLKPEPIELGAHQARELLDESGALFLRYFTRRYERPTAFWYMACNEYSFKNLPQKLRTRIRRAYKDCRIERVDPEWLAKNGYPCYLAAFSRYRNARPEPREIFDEMCRGSVGGPFEFWAAYAGDQLAGFEKLAVGQDYAASLVIKLDPRFLRLSPDSALKDTILTTYISEQGKTVFNGFRSIVHDTNVQDVLLKFGYRRVFCDLKLVYRPSVRAYVNLLYPFRTIIDRAPDSALAGKIRGLLAQEEIRRSFDMDGKRTNRTGPPISNRNVSFV